MAETVAGVVWELGRVLDRYEGERRAIEESADWERLRPEVAQRERTQALSELRERMLPAVTEVVRALFGDERDLTKPLEGGRVWQELERAREAVSRARTEAGDDLDWARLQLLVATVPSQLGRYRTVHEAREAYDSFDQYTRLAWSFAGLEPFKRRFANHAGLGSFVARLEADKAAYFRTPDVVKAEERVARADDAALRAWRVARRAVSLFDRPGPFGATRGTPGAVLRRVEHSAHVDSDF